jgi:hypothetical protein
MWEKSISRNRCRKCRDDGRNRKGWSRTSYRECALYIQESRRSMMRRKGKVVSRLNGVF